MDAYDRMAELTGQSVRNKGIWKKFFHLIRLAKVPWLGIVLYLVVSVGSIYLAVMIPQTNADFFSGNASVTVVLTVIVYELISTVLVYMMLLAYGIAGGRVDRNFRNAIWNKFLHMEPRYYEGVSHEMLLSRITNEIHRAILDYDCSLYEKVVGKKVWAKGCKRIHQESKDHLPANADPGGEHRCKKSHGAQRLYVLCVHGDLESG